MISCIIVDDEKNARQYIEQLLKTNFPTVNVLGQADSVDTAVNLIHKTQPDLVFLDIEMPNQNGFKLFEKIKAINFSVVFTTAYDQYAIKAIKYSALDYLLKPINIEELGEAITNVEQRKKIAIAQNRIELLIGNMSNNAKTFDKIALPSMNEYTMVKVSDIVCCEADGNYCKIHLLNQEKIVVSKTLKWLEDLLPEDLFFKIHKSHIINLNLVKKYIKSEGVVKMENGISLDVAERLKKDFIERIANKSKS